MHHLRFLASHYPQVPYWMDASHHAIKLCVMVSKWNSPLGGMFLILQNSVPLNGQLEVLVILSQRHPPGLDEENVIESLHWLVLSPEGIIQPKLRLWAVDLVIHRILEKMNSYDMDIFLYFDSLLVLTLYICYWLGVPLFKKMGEYFKTFASIIFYLIVCHLLYC